MAKQIIPVEGREMAPVDAAKIVLNHLLYRAATVKEREAGLFNPIPDANLDEALACLKEICLSENERPYFHKTDFGALVCAGKDVADNW